jgi:hypothetical protein
MKNVNNVPLSGFANSKLGGNFGKYFWFSLLMSFFGGAFAFGFGLFGLVGGIGIDGGIDPDSLKFALYSACTPLLTWLINFILARKAWKKGKEKILQQNEIDYVKSLAFKSLLEAYAKPELSEYSVLGNEYQAGWRPFRVEHHLSNFLRGEMNGKVCLRGFALGSAYLEGSVIGDVRGMVIPNLLDHSSVIFLKNGEKTLRVLIPSPRTAKELLVRTLEHWLQKLPKDSHTYGVLNEFSMETENFVNQLSHPQVIDSLDAACELPLESRPEVVIKGEKIQDGIVLATSLQVDEKSAIFLPSGFFRELTEKIHPFIETAEEPMLIESVREK